MSTKRNNHIQKDKFYMKLAINLAKKRIGLTGTNPSVGCVIVKNDTVISTGQTGLKGYPHAEVDAMNNLKHNHNFYSISLYICKNAKITIYLVFIRDYSVVFLQHKYL